jgi:hypothetical protein
MATWHQQKAGGVLYNESKFVVVIDPPNECRATVLFFTQDAAERYVDNYTTKHPVNKPYTYILRPSKGEMS